MNLYISDLHFGHKNVILFGCWTVYEAPHEKIFALIWKEKIVKAHLGYTIQVHMVEKQGQFFEMEEFASVA